jgi:hypothetical protein
METVCVGKLNKGKLDKASAPSWSAEIFKVTKVTAKRGTVAEKHRTAPSLGPSHTRRCCP